MAAQLEPLQNARVTIEKNGKVISGPYTTDAAGEFDLPISNFDQLVFSDDVSPVYLIAERGESKFQIRIREDDVTSQSLFEVEYLPAQGTMTISQQPLLSAKSVSTFDLTISNTGADPFRISEVQIELRTFDTDCQSWSGEKNIDDVSKILLVDVDSGLSTVLSDIPIVDRVTTQTWNNDLCATIQIQQPFDVGAGFAKRIRIDIVSQEIRKRFTDYSRGIGPYIDTTGLVNEYADTPRLRQSDLRYYTASANVLMSSDSLPGYASGTLTTSNSISPGTFPQDTEKLASPVE